MSYSDSAILSLGTSVPKTRYAQSEILEKYLHLARISDRRQRAVRTVFGLAGVEHRHSEVSDQFYATEQTTMSRNEHYMAAAIPLGEQAICQILTILPWCRVLDSVFRAWIYYWQVVLECAPICDGPAFWVWVVMERFPDCSVRETQLTLQDALGWYSC